MAQLTTWADPASTPDSASYITIPVPLNEITCELPVALSLIVSAPGARVSGVGGLGNGTVTFRSVATTVAGNYSVTIDYVNGDTQARSLQMTINGRLMLVPNLTPTRAWSGPTASKTVKIPLNAGMNTIQFGNSASPGADLDRITVQPAP